MNSQFALDKTNARMLGVCAGIARGLDVDPMLVRVNLILLTIFLGPLALIAYLLIALTAG